MPRLILKGAAIFGVFAALALGAVGVYASNNASWQLEYSIPLSTSLVNNTASFNLSGGAPGVAFPATTDSLSITSNDPAGFQITADDALGAEQNTSGGACGTSTRSDAGTTVSMAPSATTGGTGTQAGVAVSVVTLSSSASNLFSTVPTNTGTMSEAIGNVVVTPPSTIQPNTLGCWYVITINYTLIAQ